MTLISLELAKKHLIVDFDDDDQLIEGYIAASSSFVQEYLNRTYTAQSGSEGVTDAPAPVVTAVLILVATLYRDRAEQHVNATPMVLPSTVRMLLAPYRDFCPVSEGASEGSWT